MATVGYLRGVPSDADSDDGRLYDVVLASNQTNIGPCECCGGGGIGDPCFDPPCSIMPAEYDVTVAGVTNALCFGCTGYNATHRLPYLGSCIWAINPISFTVCGFVNGVIELVFDSGTGKLTLTFRIGIGTILATYESAVLTSADCLASIDMTKVGLGTGDCAGWPATLTIVPV